MGRATAFNSAAPGTFNLYQPAAKDGDGVNGSQLLEVASRTLRVLLATPQPMLHTSLRSKVLGGEESNEASKCLFELAVISLVEQQLVERVGFGSCTTLYSVAPAAAERAAQIAYGDFPDDARYVCAAVRVERVAARVPCSRRGSPRQLSARTRGVEKSRGRLKRGAVPDELAQLQAKRGRPESPSSPMSC